MRTIQQICAFSGALIAMLTMPLSTALASNDALEPDTGTQGTEHFVTSLISSEIRFPNPSGGYVTCNQAPGEGTIDTFVIVEGANPPTEVGHLESLDFLQNGSQKCPTVNMPVSSCNPTVTGFPGDVRASETTNEILILSSVAIIMACESIVGTINCHYTSPVIDGSLTAPANESIVLGATGGDDVLTGEASNSFLCPASAQVQGTLRLTTEDGQELMVTEQ
jgi:hypothetical protein